jgi:pantoate--beta-alanine ligase
VRIITTRDELASIVKPLKKSGKVIGFVPTMGFLHNGHLELVRAAKQHSDCVIVSIFVNPTQFAPNEDLSRYPRDFDHDCEKLRGENVDILFAPETHEIYAKDNETFVDTQHLSRILMGKLRPTHFRGVTTICTKLFNMTFADKAFFGEKDYQQLCIIKRMVSDLNMSVEIISIPIIREKDGLALSSRNSLLTEEDRRAAPILNEALNRAGQIIEAGETSLAKIEKVILQTLKNEKNARVESIDIRRADDLTPLKTGILQYFYGTFTGILRGFYGLFTEILRENKPENTAIIILLTVKFGTVRLIDNRIYTLKRA